MNTHRYVLTPFDCIWFFTKTAYPLDASSLMSFGLCVFPRSSLCYRERLSLHLSMLQSISCKQDRISPFSWITIFANRCKGSQPLPSRSSAREGCSRSVLYWRMHCLDNALGGSILLPHRRSNVSSMTRSTLAPAGTKVSIEKSTKPFSLKNYDSDLSTRTNMVPHLLFHLFCPPPTTSQSVFPDAAQRLP